MDSKSFFFYVRNIPLGLACGTYYIFDSGVSHFPKLCVNKFESLFAGYALKFMAAFNDGRGGATASTFHHNVFFLELVRTY